MVCSIVRKRIDLSKGDTTEAGGGDTFTWKLNESPTEIQLKLRPKV
jgi:hypothetical protein